MTRSDKVSGPELQPGIIKHRRRNNFIDLIFLLIVIKFRLRIEKERRCVLEDVLLAEMKVVILAEQHAARWIVDVPNFPKHLQKSLKVIKRCETVIFYSSVRVEL